MGAACVGKIAEDLRGQARTLFAFDTQSSALLSTVAVHPCALL